VGRAIFSTLVNKSDDGIVVIQDGLVKFANPKIIEMSAFSGEEIIGRPFLEFVAPAYRSIAAENYRRRMTDEEAPAHYEIEVLTRSGQSLPVEISASRITYRGRRADMAILRDLTERRKAEERLRQAEANFHRALDALPLGARVITDGGLTIYATRAFLDIFGYRSIAELERTPPDRRYLPDSYAEGLVRAEKRSRGEAVPEEFEVSIVRPDGQVRRLEVFHRNILWNGEGLFLLLYHDITDRRRAEEQRDFFQSLLVVIREVNQLIAREPDRRRLLEKCCITLNGMRDSPGVWMAIIDDSGRATVTAGAGLGAPFAVLKGRMERGELPFCARQAMGQADAVLRISFNGAECGDCPLVDACSGRSAAITALSHESRVYGVLSIAGDARLLGSENVTALIREVAGDIAFALNSCDLRDDFEDAFHRLREAQRLSQGIIETIAQPLLVLDSAFHVVLANRAFYDTFRLSPAATEGHSIYALGGGAWEAPRLKVLLESILPRNTSFDNYEIEHDFPGAGHRVLLVSGRRLHTEAGKTEMILLAMQDITERRRLMEQMMMQDRLASVGEMVSGVAHEINNPLTVIINLAEMVTRQALPQGAREDVTTIIEESDRIAGIVRNLLTFVRKHPQEKSPVSINTTVQRALDLRAYEMKVHNIRVVTSFGRDLPPVMASAPQLQQVFLNLIINAEYFMLEAHGRGTLTVTTEKLDDTVRVSVADDGPGISPENMRRLFNPFFTTKPVGKGTGLGLSISRGIVEEHGGRVYAESQAGKGATFIVELPASK